MKLHLLRTEDTPDGVFGTLTLATGYVLHTMEEDWRHNQPRVSCIPAGTYALHRTIYYKHRIETFEVMHVPGRTRILLHPANTEEDVEGCIGVGMRRGKLVVPDEDTPGHPLTEKRAVVASKAAFAMFMDSMLGVDEAEVEIEWASYLVGDRQ